jgi:hypothetical protein
MHEALSYGAARPALTGDVARALLAVAITLVVIVAK